jgi:hypothetical protein
MDRTKEEYESRRLIRRQVEPLGIVVDVDLYEVIVAHQRDYVSSSHVEPVIDWIEAGDVELTVIDLPRVLGEDWEFYAEEANLRRAGAGSDEHRRLIAMAALYVIVQGKEPNVGGNSLCSYAGGWADVIAEDGSLFIECGNLRGDKVFEALTHNQTIMVIPYYEKDRGFKFTPNRERMKKHIDALMRERWRKAKEHPLFGPPEPKTEINALEMPPEAIEYRK